MKNSEYLGLMSVIWIAPTVPEWIAITAGGGLLVFSVLARFMEARK